MMSKRTKDILFYVVLVLILIVVFIYKKIDKFTKTMAVQNTAVIAPGLSVMKSGGIVNFYAVSDSSNTILIDTGTDAKVAVKELSSLNINPQSVTAVFLTHSDYDHMGGIGAFSNALLYLSKDEVPVMQGSVPRFFGVIKNTGIKRSFETLDDGSVIKIGAITIQCIATPGHTPGSMSYFVNNTWLFTGDLLAISKGRPELFPSPPTMDSAKDYESIIKLIKTVANAKMVLTGHHGILSNGSEGLKQFEVRK